MAGTKVRVMTYNHGEQLDSGRWVQFFLNRETGLVVVDIVAENGFGGNEVLRIFANAVDLSHTDPTSPNYIPPEVEDDY